MLSITFHRDFQSKSYQTNKFNEQHSNSNTVGDLRQLSFIIKSKTINEDIDYRLRLCLQDGVYGHIPLLNDIIRLQSKSQ